MISCMQWSSVSDYAVETLDKDLNSLFTFEICSRSATSFTKHLISIGYKTVNVIADMLFVYTAES